MEFLLFYTYTIFSNRAFKSGISSVNVFQTISSFGLSSHPHFSYNVTPSFCISERKLLSSIPVVTTST